MKDDKRQTRLLPFRLRRSDAARRTKAARYAAQAGALRRSDADDTEMDAELRSLLRAWAAPRPSPDSRARLLADFRASGVRRPLWRRALAAELRVPLPVAACAVVALLASLVVVAARTTTSATSVASVAPSASIENPNAASNTETVVKFVEVPVVRERVVTRFVYVEKKERGAGGLERASPEGARETKRAADSRRAGTPTSFFTRVDMADFRPADEMKIKIVRRGGTDEK